MKLMCNYHTHLDNYQRKTRLLSSVVDHDPLNGISNVTPIIDDSQTNNVQIVSAMDNTISIKNNGMCYLYKQYISI